MRLHSHLLMTCLESFVRFAEINQRPLDCITRILVHVRDLRLSGRDKDRDRQRQTDRHSETDRQTDRQRETEKVRQADSQTSRHKERQQERQTDKQENCSMSLPFSLFPFHARPGLTRQGSKAWRTIWGRDFEAQAGVMFLFRLLFF